MSNWFACYLSALRSSILNFLPAIEDTPRERAIYFAAEKMSKRRARRMRGRGRK